jgi:hypothetical protein
MSGLIYRKHPDVLTDEEERGLYDYIALMEINPELFSRLFVGGI